MIAFMTDWGNSHYVGICKAVMRQITDAEIVDLTHNISPYNVREAMYILDRSVDYFPEKTVFLIVVDFGVGTARKAIAVETDKYYFVAPDNGILTLVLERHIPRKIVDLVNKKYHFGTSRTFHGRDIFSPAAAYITKGIFDELGTRLPNYATLPYRKAHLTPNGAYGEVAYFDRFGNIETNIPFSWIAEKDAVKINVGKKTYEVPVVETYADVDEGELLVHEDSTGYVEIAVNKGIAREKLKCFEGNELEILF
ncbi:SAM hydrolase/SAM-dependent halogenase family protein [Fervidobacterium gondwanense]|uniref:SAM hydrolase/SAM-dependent halogenase family protein n=1 Tax=Fervidobacterium gondwanense TaxID=44754 RepID=UPI003952011B